MRRAANSGGFILCLLLNMVLNLDGLIPAAILLALHFIFDISLWWSAAAAGVWLIGITIWTSFIAWAGKCSSIPDKPKENKNPYSAASNQYSIPKGTNNNEKS